MVVVVVEVGLIVVCAFELVVVGGCVRASAGVAITKLASAALAMAVERKKCMAACGSRCEGVKCTILGHKFERNPYGTLPKKAFRLLSRDCRRRWVKHTTYERACQYTRPSAHLAQQDH